MNNNEIEMYKLNTKIKVFYILQHALLTAFCLPIQERDFASTQRKVLMISTKTLKQFFKRVKYYLS